MAVVPLSVLQVASLTPDGIKRVSSANRLAVEKFLTENGFDHLGGPKFRHRTTGLVSYVKLDPLKGRWNAVFDRPANDNFIRS